MDLSSVEIAPHARAALVIERWPQTLDVFVAHGFTPLKNPVVRRTIARNMSIEQACKVRGADLLKLLSDLRVVVAKDTSPVPANQPGEPTPVIPDCSTAARANTPVPKPLGIIDRGESVAEVARRFPRTVPVFARLRLDACCGGVESIENAARHNGLDVDEVVAELEASLGTVTGESACVSGR